MGTVIMPKKFGIDLKDPAVIEATSMVQKCFRGYVIRKKLAADGPPRFLGEGLQDVSLVDGSAAKIVGRVKGFPDPTIAWFKDGQPIKAANSRLCLKIPTLSPLSSPTATNKMSVPTPARLTTNSVKLSIPPRSSLKSPPRSKKDQPTVPSRSDPPLPSPPPSPETPNQRSAGPRTAKMSKKMTTLPTTSTVNPPPSPSPTSPRRMLVNTKFTARTTKDSTTPSPPLPSHNFLLLLRFLIHILSS